MITPGMLTAFTPYFPMRCYWTSNGLDLCSHINLLTTVGVGVVEKGEYTLSKTGISGWCLRHTILPPFLGNGYGDFLAWKRFSSLCGLSCMTPSPLMIFGSRGEWRLTPFAQYAVAARTPGSILCLNVHGLLSSGIRWASILMVC